MGWGWEEESMDMAYPAGVRTIPALAFPGLLEYCTSCGPASSAHCTTHSCRRLAAVMLLSDAIFWCTSTCHRMSQHSSPAAVFLSCTLRQ